MLRGLSQASVGRPPAAASYAGGHDAMTTPGARGGPSTAVRLAAIGLLAAAVTGTLYAVGRLRAPDYTVSLFGQTGIAAITLKSLLASTRTVTRKPSRQRDGRLAVSPEWGT
jgi:hypothetical protein